MAQELGTGHYLAAGGRAIFLKMPLRGGLRFF